MSNTAARLRDRIGSGRALALIDGNSFYCSCERVFDSRLARVPVIVLSNNDGCAIARTAEAKALGIKARRIGARWAAKASGSARAANAPWKVSRPARCALDQPVEEQPAEEASDASDWPL